LTYCVYSNRLCFGLWQEKLVKWLAIACTVTYIAVFLTITFGCWPYASIVYHFHDICVAHLAAAFQTTGGSTLHHLVRCSLISRIVKNSVYSHGLLGHCGLKVQNVIVTCVLNVTYVYSFTRSVPICLPCLPLLTKA
jgi:hypothetical protein